jgi:transcriptional regulator with PAS, ATPase and Fis domain
MALEEFGGPALVLDADLRVAAATPGAEALLGGDVPLGVSAPKLLCGHAVQRPMAEALAAGRPVSATIPRPRPGGGERSVGVRTVPLMRGAERLGWALLLAVDAADPGAADAPVAFHGMWTRDPAMKRLFRLIERVAKSDASVLVRGETGAGKELVAQSLHALSPRHAGPFRAINCAALPPTLLESELFGHRRGAFTGAVRDNPGHFRLADKGTLFLDEIAELPLDLQAKMLRVIETRTVIPVGASEPVPFDARIVAATHRSLRAEVEAGRFRADLMYRLRVVPLFLPPLRARPGDVMLLVETFVKALNARGGRQIERVAPGARQLLERYDWPGNVRELRNVLEYAAVVGEGPVLVEADLPPEFGEEGAAGEPEGTRVNAPPALSPAVAVSPEASRIRRALERAGGNRERAAKALGLSRVTLWRRMKALGLDGAEE